MGTRIRIRSSKGGRGRPLLGGRRTRRTLSGDDGSILVETAALGAVALILVAVLVEVCLASYTAILAGHAARSGARALSVDGDVTAAVEKELPAGWKEELIVRSGRDWVEVEIAVPVLAPGEGSFMRISGYAGLAPEGGES